VIAVDSHEAEVCQLFNHLGQAAVIPQAFPAMLPDSGLAILGLDPVHIHRFDNDRLARGHPHQHPIIDPHHSAIVS
jgi:hypothetical protein